MNLTPDFDNIDPGTQAYMRRQLAKTYPELGRDKPRERFSFARYLRRLAGNLPVDGIEGEILSAAAAGQAQRFDQNRAVVPLGLFLSRAMGSTPGSKGGYMSVSEVADPVDVLRGYSVAVEGGLQIIAGLNSGSLTIPTTATATTGSWFKEFEAAAESPPTLGNVSMTPHIGGAFIKFSVQLLRQAPEATEGYIRTMLLQAVGSLLDSAVMTGAGAAEPLGLVNTTGIGTQSGTSATHATLLAMQRQCVSAGARAENLVWIAPPLTAELLAGRERVANGGRYLWDNDTVLGRPAYVSTRAPVGRLICGDFSSAVLALWGGGVQVEIDPSQDFARAGLVARILTFADVGFPNPGAFCVSSTVT